MIDLERSLVELADRLEIPGGDRLANDVMLRIGQPGRRERAPRRALVVALASAFVVILTVVAFPGPRHAVGRWLGFDSVRIQPGVTVPTTAPLPTTPPSSPSSEPTSARQPVTVPTTVAPPPLDLGPAMSIEAATGATHLPDPAPALLGPPQSTHVVQPPQSGQIVLVYAPSDLLPQSSVIGVGALVSVIPGRIEDGFFNKMLGDTSTVRSVDVGGVGGYWIEGAPHQLFFVTGGQFEADTLRLATNTLLWQRGDTLYRIEADISLETALRIAASI
ncbi:MAG: hypothetical protein QOJ74_2579 [Ilumatobacteraceae bacterium]|nr:hypothetical protein [Ilumatobacteraceae bacterium]